MQNLIALMDVLNLRMVSSMGRTLWLTMWKLGTNLQVGFRDGVLNDYPNLVDLGEGLADDMEVGSKYKSFLKIAKHPSCA